MIHGPPMHSNECKIFLRIERRAAYALAVVGAEAGWSHSIPMQRDETLQHVMHASSKARAPSRAPQRGPDMGGVGAGG